MRIDKFFETNCKKFGWRIKPVAITKPNKVGKIRIKLASLLEETIEGSSFDPAELNSNNPYYGSKYFDGCCWSGRGRDKSGMMIHVSSWCTMTRCVKNGIEYCQEHTCHWSYDISSKD